MRRKIHINDSSKRRTFRIFKLKYIFFIILLLVGGTVIITTVKNRQISNELTTVEKIIKPFDVSAAFHYSETKDMSWEYSLPKLMECYLSDEENKKSEEYDTVLKFSQRKLDWTQIHLPTQGYYETDNCFAIYINPDIDFTVDNYQEAGSMNEMVIRRVFEPLMSKKNYHPSEHTRLIAKKPNTYLSTAFGWFEDNFDGGTVFVNTNAEPNKDKSNKTQFSWRLMHEYFHSFRSEHFENVEVGSDYYIPEEMLTEYMNDLVAQKMSPNTKIEITPAIRILLEYVTPQEIAQTYLGGSNELRKIVDAQTYPGAFCSFLYYMNKAEPYGHRISPEMEQVFKDRSLLNKDYCID